MCGCNQSEHLSSIAEANRNRLRPSGGRINHRDRAIHDRHRQRNAQTDRVTDRQTDRSSLTATFSDVRRNNLFISLHRFSQTPFTPLFWTPKASPSAVVVIASLFRKFPKSLSVHNRSKLNFTMPDNSSNCRQQLA